MEDARFTRFTGDGGTAEYRATYTSYDGRQIAPRLLISPDLRVFRVDGTDFLASYRTMREAVAHVRERKGPVLVHATVIRPYSHSLSDDERLYKTPAEREAEARRDPLVLMRQFLKSEGLATDEDFADILESVEREVNQAALDAFKAPNPEP